MAAQWGVGWHAYIGLHLPPVDICPLYFYRESQTMACRFAAVVVKFLLKNRNRVFPSKISSYSNLSYISFYFLRKVSSVKVYDQRGIFYQIADQILSDHFY